MNSLKVADSVTIGIEQKTYSFIGKRNLWVEQLLEESDSLAVGRELIMAALNGTTPGQLRLTIFDDNLQGIAACFNDLQNDGLLQIIEDKNSLAAYLRRLRIQIEGVQSVIRGQVANLISYRSQVGRAVEGYELVVLAMDMSTVNKDLLPQLETLMQAGPNAGVSFLILSPHDDLGNKEILLTLCDELLEPDITASKTAVEITESVRKLIEDFHTSYEQPLLFADIQDINQQWLANSRDGLTFTIGKYGSENIDIILGDERYQRHNALISGAVGQGKSNLIAVIIHSLCQRYSPKELRLYLLDFKEGVTLKPYSNIGHAEYLPQANVLGLESDQQFGLSVLKDLFREYKVRLALFKQNDCRSLKEYREKFPDVEMPRIVVMIDEFQLMFEGDERIGNETADLLEQSVRLFRAAGIHFILATQSLSVQGFKSEAAMKLGVIKAQVPIRIALKNSLNESHQILGDNNPDAAYLRPREAVINLDYGEPSQNKRGQIAFADEDVLNDLRKTWWQEAKDYAQPPVVFDGEARLTISDLDNLTSWQNMIQEKSFMPMAVVGQPIDVDSTPLTVPLEPENGSNIVLLGSSDKDSDNVALGIMQTSIHSLMLNEHCKDAEFVFCNLSKQRIQFSYEEKGIRLFENSNEFTDYLNALQNSWPAGYPVYIFGLGLDRFDLSGADPFGGAYAGFLADAANKDVHFIGQWTKLTSFTKFAGNPSWKDLFNTRILLRCDARTATDVTEDPLLKYRPQDNRILVSDEINLGGYQLCLPYYPKTNEKGYICR
jgi:hypothetical protein